MAQTYKDGLIDLSDDELAWETFNQVDCANQSPVYSEADARASACYDEAAAREKPQLYKQGFDAAYYKAKGDAKYRRAYEALNLAPWVRKALRST